MVKILFVCHGNICRSPMAEFLFKKRVQDLELASNFHVESRATSREEIGNPVHAGTKKILSALAIDCSQKRAQQITKADLASYDYIYLMDKNNYYNITRLLGPSNKYRMLLERDIADPWYTGNFSETYQDIEEGITKILERMHYL